MFSNSWSSCLHLLSAGIPGCATIPGLVMLFNTVGLPHGHLQSWWTFSTKGHLINVFSSMGRMSL
jgi:hypothetical protein